MKKVNRYYSKSGDCSITKLTRKHCQACRFKKCCEIGMRKDLIMSDQEVNEKRELIRVNREKRRLMKESVERNQELRSIKESFRKQQEATSLQTHSIWQQFQPEFSIIQVKYNLIF